jgi:hypothetical protein
MLINEVRKEDDLFYQGPFWIIANSFLDILRGNFSIIGSKFECNYAGNYINNDKSKSQKTHKIIWRDNYAKIYNSATISRCIKTFIQRRSLWVNLERCSALMLRQNRRA